jgi:hypothetical protein
MKAFTVYQPYAHAIVAGVKHYETRPRRTHIRGRVAVHAGRLDEVPETLIDAASAVSGCGPAWVYQPQAAAETCRGAQSSEPLKSSIACLWKNLWTVWITGNAC